MKQKQIIYMIGSIILLYILGVLVYHFINFLNLFPFILGFIGINRYSKVLANQVYFNHYFINYFMANH